MHLEAARGHRDGQDGDEADHHRVPRGGPAALQGAGWLELEGRAGVLSGLLERPPHCGYRCHPRHRGGSERRHEEGGVKAGREMWAGHPA